MANIADGVYNATITAAAVYEKNGLKLELRLTLCDAQGRAFTETGRDGREYPVEKRMFYGLVSPDGAVNTKIIGYIRAFAKSWDGTDPFWFTEPANMDGIGMVEVTLKTEPDWRDSSKAYQNVKYVNELGHSAKFTGRAAVPSGDRAAIMAKYAAKLRAAAQANPTPVSAAALRATTAGAQTAPAAASAKPAAAAPAPAPATTSHFEAGLKGQGAVWGEYVSAHPGESNEAMTTAWFAAVDSVAKGKDQADFTADEWQCVAHALALDRMPF